MINKIGVENFRVFKEYTEFEIRPITLLTGPNNSGKSSLVKLILLIKQGLRDLNFKRGLHNLESFSKSLNWDKEDDKLKIRFNADIQAFLNVDIEYVYRGAQIEEINFISNSKKILSYYYSAEGPQEDWGENYFTHKYECFFYFSIDIEELINLLYENDLGLINHIKEQYPNHHASLIVKPATDSLDEKFTINNYRQSPFDDFENYLGYPDYPANTSSIYAIHNELNKIERDYLLYLLFVDDIEITKDHLEEILFIQKRAFKEIPFAEDQDGLSPQFIDMFGTLKIQFEDIEMEASSKMEVYFSEKFPTKKVEVKPTHLHKILFEEKWFNYGTEDTPEGENLFSRFREIDFEMKMDCRSIDFISANRGNQKRVLQNESDNEIDKIVADFVDGGEKNQEFLHKILGILGIKGRLAPVRYENTISVVYLEHEDKKISLADVGYGFSQVIPIILKIIMSDNLLIIEEPEANLHPALQSKFADILVESIKEFPQKRFILETHSEYLIRKLQFLSANKELNSENTVIYYFNSDEFVTHEEPKVKKIEITETGNLTENFGPGFFDEATRLQFDLLKAKKEKKN